MTQPASSVAEVIARMQATVAALPRSDGIACFTQLYLAVTEGVQTRLAGFTFKDPQFIERLDVVFADLFFSALDDSRADPGRLPRAWAPLLAARLQHGIAPLQFALAGMNAHINRDLPVALVATCREFGVGLDEASAQHADYEQVNQLLATVEAQVKAQYLTGWLRALDRVIHRVDRLDDIVAMWDIGRARDAAWINGEALLALSDTPDLAAGYLGALDRMVGLTARGLLVPADTWLQKLGRAFS